MDLKERVLNTEIYNSQETIILKNPPKLNGKPCVEVRVDFLNQFFDADIVPAGLKTCHFSGKIDESAIIVKILCFGQKKLHLEIHKDVKKCLNSRQWQTILYC